MKQHLLSSIILVLTTLILFSCKQEKSEESKIAFIKKNEVHFENGSTLQLGDSLSKVYFLIRHAEKDTQKMDPPLNEAGKLRATKLTQMLRQSWLDAVYTTLTARTMMTVDSITQYKGLVNNIYTTSNMKETFTEVAASPNINRVLIVGHSNTIPPLANFLAGRTHFNKTIDEKAYDNFIIVVQKKDSTKQVYELKY
ncbi:MAG: histidine phosphatase family protein [Saprospiraceae bacterium]|mgnify:CR=1|nr:histidine phosphatase family protein [Saprospiraceae bacterium]